VAKLDVANFNFRPSILVNSTELSRFVPIRYFRQGHHVRSIQPPGALHEDTGYSKTAAETRFRQPIYGFGSRWNRRALPKWPWRWGWTGVVIDAEHGHLDWNDILQHLRAPFRSDTVALVRIAELNVGLIKRVLDIGADGVVVPWVESADQLQKAVDFAHYPPDGLRGIGAERATCWGRCFTAHVDEANEHVLVIPIVRNRAGRQEYEELCRVPASKSLFHRPRRLFVNGRLSRSVGRPGRPRTVAGH